MKFTCRYLPWRILSLLAWSLLAFLPTTTTGLSIRPDDCFESLSSRRQWLSLVTTTASATTIFASTVATNPCFAETGAGELPSSLKDFTKLAPLGPSKPASSSLSSPKSYGLSLEQLAERLTNDLSRGSKGKGSYIISGDLSDDIFRDDCIFQDPTNRVRSLSQYKKALGILFDADESVVQVLGPLVIDAKENTISGRFRSRGFLKLPWKPYVTAYESNIVYRVDDKGLVYEQDQQWTKSSAQALRESFTPSLFSPPPKSNLPVPADEPAAVTALFDMCNGRRPDEYSSAERREIATLMQRVQEAHYPWKAELLPGQWKLVYLEPGPTGAGVDRRIPFPEFSFNDQYQIFTLQDVTNVGELFGPLFFAQVSGDLTELDPSSTDTPKAWQANIRGGQICAKLPFSSSSSSSSLVSPDTVAAAKPFCLPLPIQGEGLFDIWYIGQRVRLLQNRNGGGARGIQIKMG